MRKYELVVLINGRSSQEAIDTTLQAITGKLPEGAILATDVIGKKNMMYDFAGKVGNNVMHTVSYYVELDPALIVDLKNSFTYIENLERYFFYAMQDNQPFFTMDELKKHFDTVFEVEEKKKEKESAEAKESEVELETGEEKE